MRVDRVPLPQESCVRAYSFAALDEKARAEDTCPERPNLFWPPVASATEGELDSPCARSMVSSARVATIVRCGPKSDRPGSLAAERAAPRRGIDSPARINVCLSEFTLTVGFYKHSLLKPRAKTLSDLSMRYATHRTEWQRPCGISYVR
jgi:hypothetical protein